MTYTATATEDETNTFAVEVLARTHAALDSARLSGAVTAALATAEITYGSVTLRAVDADLLAVPSIGEVWVADDAEVPADEALRVGIAYVAAALAAGARL
ncbi:carnitine racemase [Mycolicibacterium austroafricanum]|uniref:carnitine racemase n=1 Tax=Mycolicibacterium austroafricanum TaxID=39687 RepID=UPI001CA375EB|nr:carnitine racemase [Mycolicibacterium austroafricanum]QZT56220.1 carnitine racemase [Mycolicibacterium austroafricanum]